MSAQTNDHGKVAEAYVRPYAFIQENPLFPRVAAATKPPEIWGIFFAFAQFSTRSLGIKGAEAVAIPLERILSMRESNVKLIRLEAPEDRNPLRCMALYQHREAILFRATFLKSLRRSGYDSREGRAWFDF